MDKKEDRGIVIDPLQAGNKLFAITGTLNLYGKTAALFDKINGLCKSR